MDKEIVIKGRTYSAWEMPEQSFYKNLNTVIINQIEHKRSEIHIKETENTWSTWHIASSSEWPHLFSCNIKSLVGLNSNFES